MKFENIGGEVELEVYYVQNDKQYKHLLVRLIQETIFYQENLQQIGIYGCNYDKKIKNSDLNWENCCIRCESEECELISHMNDKDVIEHFDISESDIEFPAILILADTYCNDEKVTLISIKEAKENTKYGYNGKW